MYPIKVRWTCHSADSALNICRIAIVHWYHDIRESKPVPDGRGISTAFVLTARLALAIATTVAARRVLMTYETYCDEIRCFIGALFFLGGMCALDDGSCSLHASATCASPRSSLNA